MLNECVLYINHGGQNSICDGLLYGVPQIVIPGKVFERKYNAKSITDNNAGVTLGFKDFNADTLRKTAEQVINSHEIRQNALALGQRLSDAGGLDFLVRTILSYK